jgi:hypothetical protein
MPEGITFALALPIVCHGAAMGGSTQYRYAPDANETLWITRQQVFTDLGVHRIVAHTMAVNRPVEYVEMRPDLRPRLPLRCQLAIPDGEKGEVEYALTWPDWQASSTPH